MKNILIAFVLILVGSGVVFADMEDLGASEKTQAILSAGYNWVETEDASGRAAEYMYQDVSGTASFEVKGGIEDTHYILEGDYLNENDYSFDAHFDKNNAHRLDLRIEKMFHNLDHIDYANRSDAVPTQVPATVTPRVDFADANPGDEYSLKVNTFEANIRSKLPDMPAHVKIGYWQFLKEGEKQLRFADENCAGACHLQSRTRELDRTTHQVSGGFDAHLGKFDLIASHTYREIVIDEPVPNDYFDVHFSPFSQKFRDTAGNYEHDADPESQLHESTLELHSSLAGGVNLAASATYGKRKNNSKAVGSAPIIAETEYWKGAADITHMTSSKFSYNFRARYLDMDAENNSPDTITPFVTLANGVVDVRPPIDIKKGTYELISTYRPKPRMTLKGTIKIDHIKRSHTGGAHPFHSGDIVSIPDPSLIDPVWELPDEEILSTLKLSFFARPDDSYKFKVNGYYQYQNSDEPAYGASFEDKHQIFVSSTYSINPNWGLSASARASIETNDNHVHEVIFDEGPPLVVNNIERDREKEQENISLGVWYNPLKNLTTTLNYGYDRTAIVQDLMFGTDPNNGASSTPDYIIIAKDADFLQEMHTVSGSVGFSLLDNIKATIGGHYTRSLGYYDPDFATQNFQYLTSAGFADANSADLKNISHFDIDQFGGNAIIDYYITPDFELSLKYSYDEYNEKYSNLFDGSVQTAMANVAYRF